jgi:hypothetical protein
MITPFLTRIAGSFAVPVPIKMLNGGIKAKQPACYKASDMSLWAISLSETMIKRYWTMGFGGRNGDMITHCSLSIFTYRIRLGPPRWGFP